MVKNLISNSLVFLRKQKSAFILPPPSATPPLCALHKGSRQALTPLSPQRGAIDIWQLLALAENARKHRHFPSFGADSLPRRGVCISPPDIRPPSCPRRADRCTPANKHFANVAANFCRHQTNGLAALQGFFSSSRVHRSRSFPYMRPYLMLQTRKCRCTPRHVCQHEIQGQSPSRGCRTAPLRCLPDA